MKTFSETDKLNLNEDSARGIRFLPSILLLISVDKYMGVPRFVSEDVLYFPFFDVDGDKFALSDKIYMEYPLCNIVKYEQIKKRCYKKVSEKDMSALKKYAIDSGFRYEKEKIPDTLKELYRDDF